MGPVASSCEHDNKQSLSIQDAEFDKLNIPLASKERLCSVV
jgi:hypothetical protein